MDFIELGRTGEKIPALGMGTWQVEANPEEGIQALRLGFEQGMKLVDTAERHNNEEFVGKAIGDRRDIFVATKVYQTHFSHDDVIKACEGSLSRLGVDKIDLYQLHWPYDKQGPTPPRKETMGAMEELVSQGKIRHIGVSNFSVKDLESAMSVMKENKIVSNQVEYSLMARGIEDELLDFCKKEGITVIAYKPLGRGSISGDRSSALYKLLGDIGKGYGKTSVQVALNWVISRGNICAIPKAGTREHVLENAGAAGFKLSGGDLERLDSFRALAR
ncbi:MAG: aldo/keto reductase [Candidatus Micrarchaeota archaeon]|nr:aldo/keto reductase [Candidatus Micrarchaeota archaeon]